METTSHSPRFTIVLCIVLGTLLTAPSAFGAYGWPVKPFNQQHPIRGYFGDPRIGGDGRGGISRSIHFGVDISARNGTAVYATISGRISRHPLHPTDVVLVESGGVTFEYWHIVPVVSSGYAIAYHTVLGHIERPWAHVHFAERHGSTYVNPLRPGALAPYRDDTKPIVQRIRVRWHAGSVDLVADAYDTTPLTVPAPWSDKPVSPALVEWRVSGPGLTGRWTTSADFRGSLPCCPFGAIYTDTTTQNYVPTRGSYQFVLANGWHAAHGTYRLTVRVSDTAGNVGVRSVTLRISA